MKNQIILLSIVLSATMTANCQYLERSVISSGGISSSASGYIIDQTIGELAVSTHISSNYSLFQGFQQWSDLGVFVSEVPAIQALIKVYPNPSVDHITLEIEQMDNLLQSISIYDSQGRIVYYNEGLFDKFPLSFTISTQHFHPGIYIIRLFSQDMKSSHYKFIVL